MISLAETVIAHFDRWWSVMGHMYIKMFIILHVMLFPFQKCLVWYIAIAYFSQNLQLYFSFQKDTKTTGVLFLLSITVQLHVVFLISLYVFAEQLLSLK